MSATTLAARIRAERIRLGITTAEAARRLGIARPSYDQLERAANPQASRVLELVELVGMDPRAILPELFEPRR